MARALNGEFNFGDSNRLANLGGIFSIELASNSNVGEVRLSRRSDISWCQNALEVLNKDIFNMFMIGINSPISVLNRGDRIMKFLLPITKIPIFI